MNYLAIPTFQLLHRLGMDELFHPSLYWVYDYLSILELELAMVMR